MGYPVSRNHWYKSVTKHRLKVPPLLSNPALLKMMYCPPGYYSGKGNGPATQENPPVLSCGTAPKPLISNSSWILSIKWNGLDPSREKSSLCLSLPGPVLCSLVVGQRDECRIRNIVRKFVCDLNPRWTEKNKSFRKQFVTCNWKLLLDFSSLKNYTRWTFLQKITSHLTKKMRLWCPVIFIVTIPIWLERYSNLLFRETGSRRPKLFHAHPNRSGPTFIFSPKTHTNPKLYVVSS